MVMQWQRVVEYARQARKPLVIERLDFQRKKAALEGESAKHSKMLSSFGYGRMKAYLLSRGYRAGSGSISGEPGVQFRDRPGEVYGTIRAERTSGSSLDARPSFAWLS